MYYLASIIGKKFYVQNFIENCMYKKNYYYQTIFVWLFDMNNPKNKRTLNFILKLHTTNGITTMSTGILYSRFTFTIVFSLTFTIWGNVIYEEK